MAIKEGKFGRSKLTSVWLNIDDYNFCKNNNISFAQIFRDAIREMKAKVNMGRDTKTDIQRIEELKDTIRRMSGFLDKNNLLDVYVDEGKPTQKYSIEPQLETEEVQEELDKNGVDF